MVHRESVPRGSTPFFVVSHTPGQCDTFSFAHVKD
jgi:hypothetical protein